VTVERDSASTLADRFAGRSDSAIIDRFEGVDVIADANEPPRLADATCAFNSVLTSTLAAGSHLVAVGRVHGVDTAPEHPLADLDGGYACVTRLPAVVAT
jgi:flavin reductase (DIM6/NTAB) family NADH-FMN oxidoreductase RutF